MTDWSKLKVVDLKAELKRRGLPQTGLKPQLVARLASAENEDASESEATVQGDAPKPDLSSATPPGSTTPAPQSNLNTQTDAQTASESRSHSADRFLDPQIDSIDISATKAPDELAKESVTSSRSSQPGSQADDHSSALPSVEPQEAIEDRRRRKRRSLTPPLSGTEAAQKRIRTDRSAERLADEVVTTQSDSTWVVKHNAVDEAEVNAASEEVAPAGRGVEPGPAIIDTGKEEVVIDAVAEGIQRSPEHEEEVSARQRDTRFKGLFKAPKPAPIMEESVARDSGHEIENEPDHVVDPAIHPATSALYIRDFMRPLNQLQLKSHLATLATATGREVDQDLVVSFYIDLIRTHAFVSFKSVSAAVRVRSALHGSVWPEERNRKPLWVDFIPADKVDDWIKQEQSTMAGGRSMAKKWEVVYHNVDDDRRIEASLEEGSDQSSTRPIAPRQISISGQHGAPEPESKNFDVPPLEPRIAPHRPPPPEPIAPTSFSTLDQLFQSTTAKPVLYWQPVSKALANNRLESIYNATSKDASKRVAGDINRYTFEDGDVFVDRGPEIFPGIRPPPGYRGPARGGGSRGGFQSRGGRGGAYDSYRADVGPRGGGRWDRRDSREDWYH
jgi:hypothetical protein